MYYIFHLIGFVPVVCYSSQLFELLIMGVAGSHFTKRIRRFNVVERTERVINKDKPIPAPLHKADAERLKHLLESNNCNLILFVHMVDIIFVLISDDPQLKEELVNKNSTLGKNLQSVYVTSEGDVSINKVYIIALINFQYQLPN